MGLKRMDNVGIVVDDLAATIDFFREVGLELEGRATIEGEWAGRVTGLGDQRVEIAMMRTPDGHGRLELSRFLAPPIIADHRNAPVKPLEPSNSQYRPTPTRVKWPLAKRPSAFRDRLPRDHSNCPQSMFPLIWAIAPSATCSAARRTRGRLARTGAFQWWAAAVRDFAALIFSGSLIAILT